MRTLRDERDEIEARNRAALDERGLLKDGHSLRVPMFMADAAPEDQRVNDAFERGYRQGMQDARRRGGQPHPQGPPVVGNEGGESQANTRQRKSTVGRPLRL